MKDFYGLREFIILVNDNFAQNTLKAMKFTKEQAVENLYQALTNNGKKPLRMSKRTLESHTETLMAIVADEEMELDAFVEKVKSSCESINSNMEKDQSDFVREYTQKNPQEPQNNPEPPQKTPDANDELLKRLQILEERELKREEAVTIEGIRSSVRKYLKDNNVENEKWIDSVLSMASISKDADADELGKSYLEQYNLVCSGGRPSPIGNPNPKEDGVSSSSFDDVRALRKRKMGLETN